MSSQHAPNTDPTEGHLGGEGLTGLTRTDLYCTECQKYFVAELDFSLDGDHIIECPHCRHEHCRKIQKGKVTEARWGSRDNRPGIKVPAHRVWKGSEINAETNSASSFLRRKWLSHGRD